MGDKYHRFVFAVFLHFLRHPTDVLRHYMPIGHTHQRTGVEAEEKESLMLELEAFAAKDFSESGTAGVAPFRFMVA